MSDQTQQSPGDQFLLVEDAARSLNLDSKVLRQGIACALVPIRRDNTGTIRIHLSEVPDDLPDKILNCDVQPELHVAALADEVLSLEKSQVDSESRRLRLEELIKKQGVAITRYSSLLNSRKQNSPVPSESDASISEKLLQRDAEVEKLASILDRTFRAIEIRDKQVTAQTGQLTRTADKAINLLERALREGEVSTEQLHRLKQQMSASANASVRLEHELDERNSVIKNQNALMERMVTIAERSASNSSIRKRRKRSFWQRLFGEGKGI